MVRKSYGDIHLTIIAEIPEISQEKDGRDIIIQMLADVSDELLHDFQPLK
ncbi:hypothetical protein [Sporomusa termitida]|nr:hypothetical protein [Sporomusa termitida]